MISLQQVVKLYSRRGETVTAFQCPDLTIQTGEYVAIVGPSGSGKTTLLSLLGGMLSPTSGEVLLDGQSLYRLSPAARSAIRAERMGFVFQTFNLITYLSALQNVQIPLSLSGVTVAEQATRARQALERFGLGDRLSHRPAELSVGQQQRVALARTLVNNPQVILADEPTGNLDPDSREIVLQALDQCHQEGRTIVMVTHDPIAATRARRTLSLRSGQLGETPADQNHKAA
jgi:putative ABC transport system ATP-binding protein